MKVRSPARLQVLGWVLLVGLCQAGHAREGLLDADWWLFEGEHFSVATNLPERGEGLIELTGRDAFPVGPYGTRVGAHVAWTDSEVVEDDFEDLEIIASFDIVRIFQNHTAFEASADFVHIVLETP